MSDVDRLIDIFGPEIEEYLQNISDILVFIFDHQGEIVEANDQFAELFLPELSSDRQIYLGDILIAPAEAELSLPDQEGYVWESLKFRRYSGTPYFAECVIFPGDNLYLLIGKHRLLTSEDALDKISKLNNELANKTRKLSKKNNELRKAKAKIEKVMRTDKLTKLANRRAFMEFLDKILAKSTRSEAPLSILMLDLDDFKDINDSYGHVVGDKVLRSVGKILAENTRRGDMAARFGGDEFTILLVETSAGEAVETAERLRREVKNISISSLEKTLTLSLGITVSRGNESIEELLSRADEAMYKAKQAGKDEIIKTN